MRTRSKKVALMAPDAFLFRFFFHGRTLVSLRRGAARLGGGETITGSKTQEILRETMNSMNKIERIVPVIFGEST